MILFADAADAALIPTTYQYAALYSPDCDHPTPPEQAARWNYAHHRYYTFRGAPACSMIDFEPGTRDYQDPVLLRDWLTGRASMREAREAWVYCDLSNAATAARWGRGLPFRWNVATLDGIHRSRAELSALLQDWGVPADQARIEWIAANQWKDFGPYDANICFTDSDW
jgi:hypothetical protein